MIGLRIAVQTACLRQPFRKALHMAGAMGCDGVEIDARNELKPVDFSETAARQLRKMLDDLNLRVATIRFPNRRGYAQPADLERRVEATVAALQMASRLRADVLACSLGPLPSADSADRRTLCEVLSRLAPLGDRLGVQVALETTSSDPHQVADLLEPYSPVGLGIDLSPADLVLQGRDVDQTLAALGPRIGYLRANDAVRGLGASSGSCVALGRGSVDMPNILSQLEEHNYRGWAAVEVRDAVDAEQTAGDAVAYLRAM